MKLTSFTALSAVLCLALAACYPYEDYEKRKRTTRGPQKQTAEQQKQKAEEELRKKQEEELKKNGNENTLPPDNSGAQNTPPTNPTTPTPPPTRTEYPFASKVPGREGFVFSPYNNKIIDARYPDGKLIPSGTLVQDPTYPASEKKLFRVP